MKRWIYQISKYFLFLLIFGVIAYGSYRWHQRAYVAKVTSVIQEGDLIFQTCKSLVGIIIRDATHSKYDHLGMVIKRQGEWVVYEAIEPVKFTPLSEWIERGYLSQVSVRRLKDSSVFQDEGKRKILDEVMNSFLGKSYDYLLGWSDENMYCSELIWKTYDRAFGVTLCTLKKFSDFDFSKKSVQFYVEKLYKNGVPLEESAVSPQDLLDGEMMVPVTIR